MAQVLQAQAVISATDKTGDAFASIDARLKNFARTAKGVSQDFSGFAKGAGALGGSPMPAAAGKLGATAGQRFSAGFAQGTAGISGVLGNVGTAAAAGFAVGGPVGAAGAAAGTMIFHIAKAVVNIAETAVKTAAELKHEEVRWGLAGGTPEDFVMLNKKAEEVSKKTGLSQVEVLKDIIDLYATVGGNIQSIYDSIEKVEKLKVVAINRDPKNEEAIREQFTQVMKSAELRGVTMKPDEMFELFDDYAKMLNLSGSTLQPRDFFLSLKYARAEGLKLNRTAMQDLQILSQELGPTSAGQAISSFGRQFAGGHIEHKQGMAMLKYGLIDPTKVEYLKGTQEIKSVKPEGIYDRETAIADPRKYIQTTFINKLRAYYGRMPTKEEFENAVAEITQKQTTEQVFDLFGTQKPRFDALHKALEKAKGLEAAQIISDKDPLAIERAAAAAAKDIPGRAAEDLVVAATEKLRDATRAANEADTVARQARQELEKQAPGAVEEYNAAMDRKFDIDTRAAVESQTRKLPPGTIPLPRRRGEAPEPPPELPVELPAVTGQRSYPGARGRAMQRGEEWKGGDVDVNVNVKVDPSPLFLTDVETQILNNIREYERNKIPALGTGDTGVGAVEVRSP